MISFATAVYNEADRIIGCLESAATLCDEFVVVDQASTDQTVGLARAWGATVLTDSHWGFGEASREKAVDATSGDWILVLDADETLNPERLSLLQEAPRTGYPCVKLGRMNYIDGMAQNPDHPDYQLRLFRRGTVGFEKRLHSRLRPLLEGEVLAVPGAILHDKSSAEWAIDDAQWRRILGAPTTP